MIKITVNGNTQTLDHTPTLEQFVEQKCPNPQVVITEINEKIIKRDDWHAFTLKDGDCLELVTFVGGG